jgi:K+-sensing histidine kinase KdpD
MATPTPPREVGWSALGQLAQALLGATTLEQIATTVVDQVHCSLGARLTTLWTFDPASHSLYLLAERNLPERYVTAWRDRPTRAPAVIWRALLDGAPQVAADGLVPGETGVPPSAGAERELGETIVYPVFARGEINGVLALVRAPGPPLGQTEHAVIRALADLIAVALERGQQFDQEAAAHRRLSDVLDSISDAVLAVDDRWRLTYLNLPARRLLDQVGRPADAASAGPPDAEWLGQSLWDVVPGLRGGKAETVLRQSARSDAVTFQDFYDRRSHRWYAMHAYPAPTGLSLRIREVTELRRAAAREGFLAAVSATLTTSLDYEAILQNLVSQTVTHFADYAALYTTDREGNLEQVFAGRADRRSDGLYVRATAAFHAALRNAHSLVNQVRRTGRPRLLNGAVAELIDTVSVVPGDRAMLSELAARSVVAVPLRAHHRLVGVMVCVRGPERPAYEPRDLTLLEEVGHRAALAADNALLYRAESESRIAAEAALRDRDAFLAAAAHELKTPLTSLKGFAQLALRRWELTGRLDPFETEKSLRAIERQSGRLHALVNQLLEVTRIDVGDLQLDRRPLDLSALVASAVTRIQERTDRHHLQLSASEPVVAWVDPVRFEQVVLNLLDNAVRFSPEGGPVKICLRRSETEARLAVSDRGIGIPREHHTRIFERYYRAHLDGNPHGMGLGLYLSRQIVELHGGRLDLELPPEGGSRFIVRIPIADPETQKVS